jgi:diguanylate cyclase (GGDEF)-like protein
VTRKAELTEAGRDRASVRRAKAPSRGFRGGRQSRMFTRSPLPMQREPKSLHSEATKKKDAWQLIHDDWLARIASEEELDALVKNLARTSRTPNADVVRGLVGMSLSESEAKSFVDRLGPHLQTMTRALGRRVHARVAALDLLTTRPPKKSESPIVVTPSLLERALEEASSDAVTGLPQRAHFMNLLRHELRQRRRRAVTVAFLDVDRLKHVNDTHGHARGDEVLKALARCGRTALREGDVFARIGGDEFALMLVDVSDAEARTIIARLRERFEDVTRTVGTSFSAGIVVAQEGESAAALLGRSDAAMYREKRARASLAP